MKRPQIIEREGKPQFAVLPIEEYEALRARLEDLEDLALLRDAEAAEGNTPGRPLDDVLRELGWINRRPAAEPRRLLMDLPLKEYQRESLEAVGRFCDAVRAAIGARALRPVHDAFYAETGRDFIEVPQIPGIPYFCLRVPTGGGKTLIAAHAVGVVARRFGYQDRPLCLWVAPTTTIRDQTLKGLCNRNHPYHAALREGLGARPVDVLTMEEALSTSSAMLGSSAVVVVATIQSYRIRNERGEEDDATRKVYSDNGYLMSAFSGLPGWLREQLKEPQSGYVSLSLANLMKLRGPIVVMDEAHNARTRVSFDSLARFGPLAVLELTATPQKEHDPANELYASNVLHAVSALQLSREGMIKLPVELESRDNLVDVLAATKDCRDELDRRAQELRARSGRYIRPIALIQAQPRSKTRETNTVEVVKKALTERLGVPAERIRTATGEDDDLGDDDLRGADCKVEYVLTVEKLREGWDCPFAYVLGSVGNVATERAVEQILGRVLRMPDATPTGMPELDRAYAFVQSDDVLVTAEKLCDSLVRRCGFDKDSVKDAFQMHRRSDPQFRLTVATLRLTEPPPVDRLPEAVRSKVQLDPRSGTLTIRDVLTRSETLALRDSLSAPADRAVVEELWASMRPVGTVAKNLGEYADPVRVPRLVVRDGDRSYLFEPIELDEFSWNLDACDATVSEAEFSTALNVGDRVALGLEGREGGVRIGAVEEVLVRQLTFVADSDDWSRAELVRWLDGELHRGGKLAGLTKDEGQAWLIRVVGHLLTERHADLPVLVRKCHDLANLLIARIVEHGRRQVRLAADALIDGRSPRRLETSMESAFQLDEQDYCPYQRYRGAFSFAKHAFDLIGDMNTDEARCAKRIDDHPNVARWIRNLEHESAGGSPLPLSPGNFYSDFIVELSDGRTALVEYKNAKLAQAKEEQRKKEVGELWAARSDGKCVFVWVVEKDWASLEAGLAAKQP